jgi:hypothetical protein
MSLPFRLWNVGMCLLVACGCWVVAMAQDSPGNVLTANAPLPAQPGEDAWKFVADLKTPLWSRHPWSAREVSAGEADLRGGVRLDARFPDHEELLKTAYADLSEFLVAGKVPRNGPCVIETAKAETTTFEAFRIEVTSGRCRILAADTEGIRRGIFCVEDMMLRAGGPFLPLGTLERKPFIKSRISRCFFGPINRPPKNRDELMDDVDYYPDQYLNRMAHDGVNGLWLSILFKDLCKTSIVPEFGNNVERRLTKLRQTVEKCRRHGIRIYLYTNEPAAWDAGHPVLKRHPELLGGTLTWWKGNLFCPWSDVAQKYLYEATHGIFSAIPHLGGMINITHGECLTTCLSSVACTDNAKPTCPLCAKKTHWETINRTLSPMAKGMHDANPEADLLAWFYMPDVNGELADWVYEIPKHLPQNVTLQFNFESGVMKEVFGKGRKGGDYWLSTPGPSPRFEKIAYLSQKAGAPVSAKIQTGCSHEVATVPFVPVPGNLYQKFRAMRELGVTRVMLCWYFGNYPGLMNKAAGELSFEPFPETEDKFLHGLASIEWGRHADAAVQAWQCFAEGYRHFPLTTFFQYWGPMHDGVVWPLLLRPHDAPLAPTWQIASWSTGQPNAPSGDRIGEALGQSHTMAEAIELCRLMSERWDQGLKLLRPVEIDPVLSTQQRLDIGVAKALGIQFRSGLNILRFYDLRERMTREKAAEQLVTLKEIRQIVEAELKGGEELIELCRRDSRLGFHSEAEGYKYYPDKIRWRMNQLQAVLTTEMPALTREIERGVDVFAEYTGRKTKGPTAHSSYCANISQIVNGASQDLPYGLIWQSCTQPASINPDRRTIRWTCCHDRDALYLLFDCTASGAALAKTSEMVLTVEPRRMWPTLDFTGEATDLPQGWPRGENEMRTQETENCRGGWMRIPFVQIGIDPVNPGPLRINVGCRSSDGNERDWIARKPWEARLLLGNNNPDNLGWLIFDPNP